MMRTVIGWIVVAIGTVLGAFAEAPTAMVGEAAPAFALPSVDGRAYSLADFRGSYVVLEWTNYDCPFVRKFYNAGAMQALQKELAEKGIIWLSICSSAPGKQGHFTADEWKKRIEKWQVAAKAVLLDADGKIGRTYQATNTPHMFVIDPNGVLIYAGALDDKPSADPKDIPEAKNYVRATLEAAWAGRPVETPSTKAYGCSVKY